MRYLESKDDVLLSQVVDVLEGRMAPNLSLEQNLALNDLKQAWRYALDEPHDIDFEALIRLNLLIANDILVHSGEGILAIPVDLFSDFFELLIAFYETNIPDELIVFLQNECIEKPEIGKTE